MEQHGSQVVLGPSPSLARQFCSALLCCSLLICSGLVCFILFQQDISSVSSSVLQFQLGKCSLQPSLERKSVLSELTYIDRSHAPVPMKTLNSLQFNWSKRHCPDQSEWCCSDWSVKIQWGVDIVAQLYLDRECLSPVS